MANRLAGKALHLVKRSANSNKHTKRLAQKAKRLAIAAIGQVGPQELYNLSSFYPTISDYYRQQHDTKTRDPLISILLPTYNTPDVYLRECIQSIIEQSYAKWELCIADDKSTDSSVLETIKQFQKLDSRIKLVERPQNGHISLATNSALEIAKGEFVALMDHDDILWPNALYEMVQVIRSNKAVDFIYSDEDKIDGSGTVHSYPFLKPDFSPEFLESCNYITHFSCIRRSVMEQIGGFRKGYEGAQDWDLFIRIGELTQQIVHIPKLLYSWRIHEASTASDTDAKPYVYEAQRKLLVDHVKRTKQPGVVETGIIRQHRTIKYELRGKPTVSVVIFYSNLEKTRALLTSMTTRRAGVDLSVTVLTAETDLKALQAANLAFGSQPVAVHALPVGDTDKYQQALELVDGDFLIIAEDTATILSDDWAMLLIADAQRSGVGLVAPVILDDSSHTVLSAGIGLGYGASGYEDMLCGMPFDDPHYSRGLYVKSRRNISACNPLLFAISRAALTKTTEPSVLAIAVELLAQGYRHVYSPYIQVSCAALPTIQVGPKFAKDFEDRYLNPNFDHHNQRLEVRP